MRFLADLFYFSALMMPLHFGWTASFLMSAVILIFVPLCVAGLSVCVSVRVCDGLSVCGGFYVCDGLYVHSGAASVCLGLPVCVLRLSVPLPLGPGALAASRILCALVSCSAHICSE